LVSGRMLDYIEMEDGFTIVKMMSPKEIVGQTLNESQVRRRYRVNIIGVKSPNSPFRFANPDTLISAHDVIVVSGAPRELEQFAARPLCDPVHISSAEVHPGYPGYPMPHVANPSGQPNVAGPARPQPQPVQRG